MGIDEHKSKDLDNREMHIVNELNNSINLLDLTIRKLEQEQRIFVRMVKNLFAILFFKIKFLEFSLFLNLEPYTTSASLFINKGKSLS